MLQRVRRFAIRLHKDETGPNTVEWVLLIIVALLVLVGIFAFIKFVMGKLGDAQKEIENPDIGGP